LVDPFTFYHKIVEEKPVFDSINSN